MKIEKIVNNIINSKNVNLQITELFQFIKHYNINGRPKSLGKYEIGLIKKLPSIMSKMSFENLLLIVPDFFHYSYTLNLNKANHENQKRISDTILKPFVKTLKAKIKELEFPTSHYKPNSNQFLIYCRHAITYGAYAPGKQIYTITSALLKSGKDVSIYSRDIVDEEFLKLSKQWQNLRIFRKKKQTNYVDEFIEITKLCRTLKPTKIITEIPVGIPTAMYCSKYGSQFIYWSAGFYRVPWYDYKLMVPEVSPKIFPKSKDFIKIPHSLNFELLKPSVDKILLEKIKNVNLKLKKNDFLIGTFARYEKLSKVFLKMVLKILQQNPNRKIVLAGPNDQTLARKILAAAIKNNQAILLGYSKTNILGFCCDVFLDTFPFPCGYAALETMAKGKPVLTIQSNNNQNYLKVRVPESVFKNENELEKHLSRLEKDQDYYNKISKKNIEIATSLDQWKPLAKKIISL